MHEVLVNRLGGLSLPRKSVVRLTDRPDRTLDVYRGRKTTPQQQYFLFSITKQSKTESRMGCCYEGNHIDREHIQHVTLRFDFKSVSTLRLYNYNYTSSN